MAVNIKYENNIIICPPTNYVPEMGLGMTLFKSMKKYGNSVAQIDVATDSFDTFTNLLQRCIRIALQLQSRGIKAGDIISVCSYHHINAAVPVIAAQFLGAITANLDPVLPVKDSAHLISLVKPKIIFSSKKCVKTVQDALINNNHSTEVIVFESREYEEMLVAHSDEAKFQPITIKDLNTTAFICFSSGSTGLPKAVCLKHSAVLTYIYAQTISTDDNEEKNPSNEETKTVSESNSDNNKFLIFSSLYWISGMIISLQLIMHGQCRLLAKFDPDEFWRILERYQPMFAFMLPVQATAICKLPRNSSIQTANSNYCKSVKRICIAGTPISRAQLDLIRQTFPDSDVYQVYGQSETTSAVTNFNFANSNCRELIKSKPTTVGLPINGVMYKIVDPENTNRVLGMNQKGELWIKSSLLMNGYLGVDLSETFEEDGWLRTGDIMYYDEEFCFYVVDRLKEMLKYDGWVIAPAILELELLSHPAVMQAVVIGIPHEEDGDHAIGLVVLKSDMLGTVTEVELEKFVEGRVHEKQRLRAGVKIVQSFPCTATGKIKRRTIREMVLNGEI